MNYLKKNLHVARNKIINREQYASMMDQSFQVVLVSMINRLRHSTATLFGTINQSKIN